MNPIYILVADQTPSPYEESQVRAMLQQGLLSLETYYWKEGMTEWRPLKELAGAPANAALPFQAAPQYYQLAKNPEPLATLLEVLLGLFTLTAGLCLYGCIGQLNFVYDQNATLEEAQSHDDMMAIFAWFSIGIYVLTIVPFAMWIYRSNRNCHGFARNLNFTPGWSVGWYFIPFLNLVRPCQCMQEIWKASSNPSSWQTERGSVLVGFWWTFWLLTGITGQITFRLPEVHDRDSLETTTLVLIALESLKIVLGCLAFAMVHVITQKQKNLRRIPVG